MPLFQPDAKVWAPAHRILQMGKDGLEMLIQRLNRRGRAVMQDRVRVGPNSVHAYICREKDQSIEHIGCSDVIETRLQRIRRGLEYIEPSHNLLTNIGRDAWAGSWGFIGAGVTSASPSTGISSSSITTTGTPLTASNLATPQLGLAGQRVYAAPHTTTNPVVYGNIVSNTTSVITVDKWWTAADGTGTTPTSGDGFIVAPGSLAAIRFMALSTNASAASASDTVLASEVTASGCGRVLATYAHTFGASTLTLSNTFTASGSVAGVHKAGLFAALTAAGADPMFFETVLSADATLGSGDTLSATWTITPSG